MGRLTPDMPYDPRSIIDSVNAILQGPPKTIKPPFNPPGQGGQTVGYGPFKCDYCGRYGQPGICEGCGAANKPAPIQLPVFPANRVVRCDGAGRSRLVDASLWDDTSRHFVQIPEFPTVKR